MVDMAAVRARPAAVALAGWTLVWSVGMAWNGGTSWHFFVQGAQAHLDATAPVL
ncbi:hypothetical protein ABZS66_34790 [Dactylosporangium sp. NPDC005572]|uniref:hypothetical protein n=1 Tax=Dactylosporangium sp. NPDC005572 TaxID=3156889 RepID=UPI0033BEFF42